LDASTRIRCTAFAGLRCVASGALNDVVSAVKKTIDESAQTSILIFDDATSELIEVDFRGSADEVLKRLAKSMAADAPAASAATSERSVPRGPGRPKLGVVAREVTLLPRHWDWVGTQPGGASVALRKLVEEARRANHGRDRKRRAQEVTYRFMSAIAGNLPNFEDAARALFACDRERFDAMLKRWPKGIRDHAARLSAAAFDQPPVN